jgi:preprotein translocase subunit Sec61beta
MEHFSMGRIRKSAMTNVCLLLACSALLGGPVPAALQATTEEYKVKAVFLFHFAQFVEWPEASFSEEQEPLIIGVLGEDPFGSFLDEVVAGEDINGHPLTIRRFNKAEDAAACHILFMGMDGISQLRSSLEMLKDHNVLTVGDSPAFIRAGGMIRFFSENNKIRLQINPDAARASGVMISSKLLRLADISIPKS